MPKSDSLKTLGRKSAICLAVERLLMRLTTALVMLILASAASSRADIIFSDGFEGTLDQWIGRDGGAHSGVIVNDPLDPTNHVLSFTGLAAGGDVFSLEVDVFPSEFYVLSFDYLGLPLLGSPEGSFVGMIGIADETSSQPLEVMKFLAGTCYENNILIDIADDGAWHSYSLAFIPQSHITITDGAMRIMVEDWVGEQTASCPHGVVGDVFFDNIRLEWTAPVTTEQTTWGKVKALFR